jgi:glyoxylase-like metal-dependent hydrolase (beta-lactamase superfamily II)
VVNIHLQIAKIVDDAIYSIDGLEFPFPGASIVPYLILDEKGGEKGTREEGEEESPGLTLIDTGFAWQLPKIEDYLKEIGYDLKQIRRIVLTHLHIDHVQAANEIKRQTRAKIYAHWADVPHLANNPPHHGQPKENVVI